MCGIIAISGCRPVEERLLDGLHQLEYRGYDSMGLAVGNNGGGGGGGGGGLTIRRAAGQLDNLRTVLAEHPVRGVTGIAHTRWATHGRADEKNAHPHSTGGVAIVHNGIIENYYQIRDELKASGHRFDSETDSEVIAHLIAANIADGQSAQEAFDTTVGHLCGSYAIVAMFEKEHGLLLATRHGSPLAVASGSGETFIGSDALALSLFSRDIVYLDDGDTLTAEPGAFSIRGADGLPAERPVHILSRSNAGRDLGEHRHFMEKEIHEQPEAIAHTLSAPINLPGAFLQPDPRMSALFADADRAVAIGCGSSFYAAGIAKFWFEAIAHLSLETDIASEYRYRSPCLPKRGPALFISQSGETADTLAALAYCKERGIATLGICNVPESSLERQSDLHLRTMAGPEKGVASTKTFTAQLAALAILAVAAAKARGHVGPHREKHLIADLAAIPRLISESLAREAELEAVAEQLTHAACVLYLGRGHMHPIAMEGALKLKEISYIHAEGYAAGELKHGPLALIEDGVPVVATLVHNDGLFAKTLSNMEEVAARGARLILVTDDEGARQASGLNAHIVAMPTAPWIAQPFVAAIAMQFLAYHTAVKMGRNVDRPRNLAKSVTVE